MKDRVCCSCGHIGKPVNQPLATFMVDFLAWGTIGGAAVVTGILPLALIPLAWSIYHLAKFRTTTCPACGDLEMVSMNSRKGKEVLNPETQVTVWKPIEEELKKAA